MGPRVLGKEVGPIGYGLLSLALSDMSNDEVVETIKVAVDAGCTYLNGGEFYGTPERNSLTFLRAYFDRYPQDADRVVVNIKGALGPSRVPEGSRASVTASIENCLRMLGPGPDGARPRIDQFEPARRDPRCDFEGDTLATVDGFVRAGRVGGIALSEVNVSTIRSAAARFAVTAVEIELSLFTTEPLTNGILAACGELGIPVLAYCPLGRGLLGGQLKSPDDLPEILRANPRFHPDNLPKNLELVGRVEELARRKGCTPAQVALGWILALSRRPGMPAILPIPGTSRPDRIRENATVVDLTDADLAEIDTILASFVPAGERYQPVFTPYLDL